MVERQILVQLVCALIDADPAKLRFSQLNTGKHNYSFWVESVDRCYVLRIAPSDETGLLFYQRGMMRQEPDLHDIVRSRTSIPIPEIVGYDFSRKRIPCDYLLMAALPGSPMSDPETGGSSTLNRTLKQIGHHLRELHTLSSTSCLGETRYGYLGAHKVMAPQPAWSDAFRVMWNKLLDDVVSCGSYLPDEARVLRKLLDRHIAHFKRPVSPSLLHMDVWSENILVDEAGNVTGLLDFDRALWGDIEMEFAVLDYCGISQAAFWAGYGTARDESPAALIRRQFYLLYEIQKFMPLSIWRDEDPVAAAAYKKMCAALVAPLNP